MQIKIKYKTSDDHIKLWCGIFNKWFNIAPKELELVVFLVKKQIDFYSRNFNEKEINDLMLSTQMRVDICSFLNLNSKTLNTYINTLRSKNILIGNLIHEKLIPSNTLTFNFYEDK